MYGSAEQEINSKKPERADRDIVGVLLQRPGLRDGLQERPKKFSFRREKNKKQMR